MEILLRATLLLLLPFLLRVALGQPFFFENPLFGDADNKPDYETDYAGGWELVSDNSGVSAMHLVVMHTNKAVFYDATNFGPSQVPLPQGNCRKDPLAKTKVDDCWAHAVQFDAETADIRPLKILTNTWCSSGGFSTDGTLVSTGGWFDGGKAVRYLSACDTCDWEESQTALSAQRWYSTQQILPDGSFIVVGGRRQFNYEYVPAPGKSNPTNFQLPFLRETTDESENNLYPFVHLSTDGDIFIFANDRSILLDPRTNKIVREFPVLKGGSRNYPASGSSVLLPVNLNNQKGKSMQAEVLVCGGASPDSAKLAAVGTYKPALRSCGRITITKPDAKWHMELMPTPRVMGDMLLLPNAEVLLINGASKGASGWGFARDPVLEPVIYRPTRKRDDRFQTLNPTTIPRMYHSSSAVLPDGRILVGGSNTNNGYNYTDVLYPTELRVEKFYPPYLDTLLAIHRPTIDSDTVTDKITYDEIFSMEVTVADLMLDKGGVKVTMYSPPFTTHGYSMSQRLLILRTQEVSFAGFGRFQITVKAPPSAVIAPPGYYMVFVVNRGVPSPGVWIHIQ